MEICCVNGHSAGGRNRPLNRSCVADWCAQSRMLPTALPKSVFVALLCIGCAQCQAGLVTWVSRDTCNWCLHKFGQVFKTAPCVAAYSRSCFSAPFIVDVFVQPTPIFIGCCAAHGKPQTVVHSTQCGVAQRRACMCIYVDAARDV